MTVGDEAIFKLNGHTVMRLSQTRIGRQSNGKSLKSGRIQIQSEAAEVFYRNVRIRAISELPADN